MFEQNETGPVGGWLAVVIKIPRQGQKAVTEERRREVRNCTLVNGTLKRQREWNTKAATGGGAPSNRNRGMGLEWKKRRKLTIAFPVSGPIPRNSLMSAAFNSETVLAED